MRTARAGLLLGLLAISASPGHAASVPVSPGENLQAAIDAASAGDVLELGAGRYDGDIDFGGKAVTVRGVGTETVIRGTGDGPVVTFSSGEGTDSVLDSVTVTGGEAARGGGILIDGASPTVLRCAIVRNRAAAQGSGIHVTGGSLARIYNNLVFRSRRRGNADPHGIEIVDASPTVVNNTVVKGDSNGLIIRGTSSPLIANNVFAINGSRVGRKLRGRGICDFSGGAAVIRHNVFFKNRKSAILRSGTDSKKIARLENELADPNLVGNTDGNPRYHGTRGRKVRYRDFTPRGARSRARDAGDPAPEHEDLDGTRNDAGFTGGPYPPGSTALPGNDS